MGRNNEMGRKLQDSGPTLKAGLLVFADIPDVEDCDTKEVPDMVP